jgi:hypothetical protein
LQDVYLETTIPSYLAAHPSRDLIVAAHQQITHEWWPTAKSRFNLYISEAVFAEIKSGDNIAISRRLEIVKDLPILKLNDDVRFLANSYEKELGLTGRAKSDIPHFAFAVSHKMDYLVTWNCNHIANGEIIQRLININKKIGRSTPLILTPEEIMAPLGDNNYER